MPLLGLLRTSPAVILAGGIPPSDAVYGPTIRALGGPAEPAYTPRLSLWVLERDETPVVELPDAYARRFTRRNDGTGSGEFTLQLDDPDLAEVTYGRLARFYIDGLARATIIIRTMDKVEVAKGEEVDEVLTVQGPDWFDVLEEGLVGPGSAPTDNPDVRPFNLSSPPASGVTVVRGVIVDANEFLPGPKPVELPNPTQVLDVAAPEALPINFPTTVALDDTVAQWMTAPLADGETPSDAPLYLVQTFEVTDGALPQLVQVGTSGPATVYVDGAPVAKNDQEYARSMLKARLMLDAGEHTMAVVVDQPADGAKDPAVIARVSQLDADAKVAATLAVTAPVPTAGSSTTTGAVRSSTPPRVLSAGAIVGALVAEAQTRGCFPNLTLGFDAGGDSDGEPWPAVAEFSASVGDDTVATVCRKLTEAGYGYFRMAPGQMRLDGYATLPTTAVATLAAQVNLEELKHEGVG